MSRTRKDLKSSKNLYGKYKGRPNKRKMTPYALEAQLITGKDRGQIEWRDSHVSWEEVSTSYSTSRSVKSIRRRQREARRAEVQKARAKLKRDLRNLIEDGKLKK